MPKFPFAFGVAESPKGDSPYGAADTLSRGLRRILCGGTCKPIAGSHAAEPMGWISSYLDRRPLPRHGGGVGGAESSAASGGCSEAEHPQRSKKSSKRAARRFFRAPQGGGGRCACGYLGSVSVRSTDDASASFVSSTASDRKRFVKGESVPLDRVLPTFARTKVGPRRVGVQMNTFCKTPRRRRRNKAGHSLCRQSLRFAPLTTSLYTREALGTCVQFMPLQKAPRRLRRLQS